MTSSPGTHGHTGRSPPPGPPSVSGSAPPSPTARCNGSLPPAGPCRANSTRRASARNGATPRCCAGSAAVRWRRSARSWSRWSPRPSPVLPPPVAALRLQQPAAHRRAGPCRRAAPGRARARVGAGEADPAEPRHGLPPGDARRADDHGRGRLGRGGGAARQGRLGLPLPRRQRAAAAASPAPAGAVGAPRVRAHRALRRIRPLLPPDRRPGPGHHPSGLHGPAAGRRPVGPGLVRAADQRHPGPAAFAAGLGADGGLHRPPFPAQRPTRGRYGSLTAAARPASSAPARRRSRAAGRCSPRSNRNGPTVPTPWPAPSSTGTVW
ncbi:hypothetical protein SFIMM107S_00780 [Streptomyces griseus]